MELVDEVAAKLVREFHKVVEVLGTSSCRARGRPWFATGVTARTTFPSVSSVPFQVGGDRWSRECEHRRASWKGRLFLSISPRGTRTCLLQVGNPFL